MGASSLFAYRVMLSFVIFGAASCIVQDADDSAQNAELQAQIDKLQGQNAELQAQSSELHDALNDATSRLAVLETRMTAAEDGAAALASRFIATSRELLVPSDFTTLPAALRYLDDKIIAETATVTIRIADATYHLGGPIKFCHRDGARIEIRGNESAPARVALVFDNGSGLELRSNCALGYLGGVAIQRSGPRVGMGIAVYDQAAITLGDVDVSGFYVGLAAGGGWAQVVPSHRAYIHDNQFGVSAGSGGHLLMSNSTSIIEGSFADGAWVTNEGVIEAQGVTFRGNVQRALWISNRSFADITGAAISGGDYGVVAEYGAMVLAFGATFTDLDAGYWYSPSPSLSPGVIAGP